MSFACYTVDAGVETSEIFWTYSSVVEQVGLCDYETTLPVFLRHLPRDGVVVDAGCGLARWVMYLRRRGYQVLGIDRAQAALAQARRSEDATPLCAADTRRLPIRDHSLAGIISLGVIEHDPAGPQGALRELHRVLRRDGIAIIGVPYNNPWRRLLVNHLRRLRDWRKRRAGLQLGFAEFRFTARELTRLLRQAGFGVLAMHPDDFTPPLAKGLWADSSAFFGYRVGLYDLAPGRRCWEMNRRGRVLQAVANRVSPWLIAGGVLAVARPD